MRIGFGYDIHRLVRGRKLVVGGVTVPGDFGEAGFSDGDVLIHAVIDALLGALALGDIGTHFPSSDPRYKDINSIVLLKETRALLQKKGASIINIDSSIVLEKPKLNPYIKLIQESLAQALALEPAKISVKAKTKEGQDSVGKGKAIEAYAVVLVNEKLSSKGDG